MRVVAISDTHCYKIDTPGGDLLIHSGDLLSTGTYTEWEPIKDWLIREATKYKFGIIFTGGNHDFVLDRESRQAQVVYQEMSSDIIELYSKHNVVYLNNTQISISGIKFYASAYQPEFYNWAFNKPRGGEFLKANWAAIPNDVNYLITHAPPMSILDEVPNGQRVGCELLAERLLELKQLKYHQFGHIHHSYGEQTIRGVTYMNASICNEAYHPVNPPFEFDLYPEMFKG